MLLRPALEVLLIFFKQKKGFLVLILLHLHLMNGKIVSLAGIDKVDDERWLWDERGWSLAGAIHSSQLLFHLEDKCISFLLWAFLLFVLWLWQLLNNILDRYVVIVLGRYVYCRYLWCLSKNLGLLFLFYITLEVGWADSLVYFFCWMLILLFYLGLIPLRNWHSCPVL
jgi:hypothetical protein